MALKRPFIGQMDRKISIYELVKIQNDIGEAKEEKQLVVSCWARVDADTGSENVEGNVRHLMNKKFTIRYNNKVLKEGNQFVIEYMGQDYSITHVVEIGRRSHLQLICFSYD